MDLGATYYVDFEGADVLQSIKKGLDIHHIKFHLAEVSKEVLHFLESTGVDRVIGRANICQSVDEAVQEFLHEEEAITGARVERENRSS